MIHATLACAALLTLSSPARLAIEPAPATPLERALDTINADEIKSDIYFIASDEMAGRDTPSSQQRIAARFLRARLQRLGWQPGAKDGYFYDYEAGRKRIDEAGCSLRIGSETGRKLVFGQDYWYTSLQDLADRKLEGTLVYCGAGSEDEFKKAEVVKGKWALCLDSGSGSKRRQAAAKAGALGLVVMRKPGAEGPDPAQRYLETTQMAREGSITPPGARPGAARGPTLVLSDAAARSLLELAQVTPAKDWLPELGAELAIPVAETCVLQDKGGTVPLENVCGFWPGSDSELKDEVVILSAHYDHVGTRRGVVFNGADDNGSGTCALLAVAEALKDYGPMRRSVMLMWVSGEEKGLWGSKAFAANPWFPDDAKPVANINIDMVGRNAPDVLNVTPTEKHKAYNGLTRIAYELAPLEGFDRPAELDPLTQEPKIQKPLGSADEFYSRSDHIEFAKLGIPIVFFFSGLHEDYHQSGDDADKIDFDKVQRVGRLVLRILDRLQADKLEL